MNILKMQMNSVKIIFDLLVSEALARQPDVTKNYSGATFNSATAKKIDRDVWKSNQHSIRNL